MPAYRSFAEQAFKYFARPHDGIPASAISSPAAWYGKDLRDHPARWRVSFSDDQIKEIENAVAAVRNAGLDIGSVNRDNFPLPTLSILIREWQNILENGRGFICVRGLPVQKWGDETSALAYWGLGHHLGMPGAQNATNDLLGHVADVGDRADDPDVRQYRTAGNIEFHCDAADVVGLLCLRPAKEGGQSRIASSVTVFNEIIRSRPDLAPLLFEPISLDRRGEQNDGEPPTVDIPPCAFADGRLRTFWHGEYFRTAQRHDTARPLTDRDRELLDLYDTITASPDIHLDMWLEPGDMQFISNHTTVHARTAYKDHEDSALKRHLLRLWLSYE